MKTWRIVQHIFEGEESAPTLTHIFYGETRERALAVYNAHMKTDSFMRACTIERQFRDFRCHARSHFEHLVNGNWVVS